MATYDLTISPSKVAMNYQANTGQFVSPLVASTQTIDRGGMKWAISYTFNGLTSDNRGTLMGLLMRLRGKAHRIRVKVAENPGRGGYGGTPLVDGASQTGSVLNVDGVSNKTNWIMAGDYFSVTVNGDEELKMCTVNANSSGGDVTINFEPRLRASPLNNAALRVFGDSPGPAGVFLLAEDAAGWVTQLQDISSFTLTFIEDVMATQ